jgi:hypothetical protein
MILKILKIYMSVGVTADQKQASSSLTTLYILLYETSYCLSNEVNRFSFFRDQLSAKSKLSSQLTESSLLKVWVLLSQLLKA